MSRIENIYFFNKMSFTDDNHAKIRPEEEIFIIIKNWLIFYYGLN